MSNAYTRLLQLFRSELDQQRPGNTFAAMVIGAFNEASGSQKLQLVPEPPVVFNPREIESLENLCQNSAISAMQAWVFVRPEVRPSHGELIQLGRQLSVRYPGLIKRGPTRYYRITKQAKGATATPGAETMQSPS